MKRSHPPPAQRPKSQSPRIGTPLAALVTLTACIPSVLQPPSHAPSGTTPNPAAPPPHPRDRTPTADLTSELLRTCISSPSLLKRSGCAWRGKAGTQPTACGDFAPTNSSDVDVLTILVVPAPFDFAAALGVPSMQSIIEVGTPDLAPMKKTYQEFEGPHWETVADGRQIKLEARGLMLGGVVHWATLTSPGATFDTVVVRYLPLHDSPLADSDRRPVEEWDLATITACIDALLWPKPIGI